MSLLKHDVARIILTVYLLHILMVIVGAEIPGELSAFVDGSNGRLDPAEKHLERRFNSERRDLRDEPKSGKVDQDEEASTDFENDLKEATEHLMQEARKREKETYEEQPSELDEDDLEVALEKESEDKAQRSEGEAADRAFERIIKYERERVGGSDAEFRYGGSKGNAHRTNMNFCRPIGKASQSTPKPDTGPTQMPICLPDPTSSPTSPPTFRPTSPPTSSTTFRPTSSPTCSPTSSPSASPSSPMECGKSTESSKLKHKKKKKKKRPKQKKDPAAVEAQLKGIQALKQHAIRMVKDLNRIEWEVLGNAPETCARHGGSKAKAGQKKSKADVKVKTKEQLDRPKPKPKSGFFRPRGKGFFFSPRRKGFFFGLRPPDAEETAANKAIARAEENKLEQKVREELLMVNNAKKSEAESQQRLLSKEQEVEEEQRTAPEETAKEGLTFWRLDRKPRYKEAPEAAARLVPVLAKEKLSKPDLKVISVIPKETSIDASTKPAAPIIVEYPGSQKKNRKYYAISRNKLIDNKKVARKIHRGRNRQKGERRRKKKQRHKSLKIVLPERMEPPLIEVQQR